MSKHGIAMTDGLLKLKDSSLFYLIIRFGRVKTAGCHLIDLVMKLVSFASFITTKRNTSPQKFYCITGKTDYLEGRILKWWRIIENWN